MPSCTASWQDIQERLKLNSQEQEHLQELVVVLNAENNENGINQFLFQITNVQTMEMICL
jgi:hypothetical protein